MRNENIFIDFSMGPARIVGVKNNPSVFGENQMLLREANSNVFLDIFNHTSDIQVADAAITNVTNSFVVVRIRNGLPVIFVNHNYIAVVHVCWQNLFLGLLEDVIENLQEKTDLGGFSVFIGPAWLNQIPHQEKLKNLFLQERTNMTSRELDFSECFKEEFDITEAVKLILKNFRFTPDRIVGWNMEMGESKNRTTHSYYIGAVLN